MFRSRLGHVDSGGGFQRLYEEHGRYVQSLVLRLLGPTIDPQDLTQEVFLVALKKYDETISHPRAWLTSITYGLVANVRRSGWFRELAGRKQVDDSLRVDWYTPELAIAERELVAGMYRLLETLPEKKRIIFIMAEIEGLSCIDIAEILKTPLKTVYSRLCAAREALRAELVRLGASRD